MQFLSNAEACANYDPKLKMPYNKTKGVLRKVENDENILDENGQQRFYRGSNMHVICGGKKYLIANNWFGDPPENGKGITSNRRAFYNWLVLQTKSALKNR